MKKLFILFAIMLVAFLFSTTVYAQDEVTVEPTVSDLPEAATISVGSGAQWGGMAGVNYINIPEDSQFGLTLGVGWSDTDEDQFGYNAGIVWRPLPEYGLFASYGMGAVLVDSDDTSDAQDTVRGITLGIGSIPVDSGDFIWRVGYVFANGNESGENGVLDIGIGFAF
jgi:outer membrane receptor protein involved in Fe transport